MKSPSMSLWSKSEKIGEHPLPREDLDYILHQIGECWKRLAGARVLFTGASGFFGSWMLESFLHAGTKTGLSFRAIALTRNARRFSEHLPHLAGDPRVEILEADATALAVPEGPLDAIIHSLVPRPGTPLPEMDAFFYSATDRLFNIAAAKATRDVLLCSTGAVYRPKDPPAPFFENDPLVSATGPLSYGQIRRRVEDQCRNAACKSGVALKIARGFTFVGPRLPLDGPFAIGNFLRDALAGGPIVVKGDGSPMRSYLYAADMAAWLWTILLDGPPGRAFNVGSEEAVSIGDLAREIGRTFGVQVFIDGKSTPGAAPPAYVPCTNRARVELGLCAWTGLQEAIKKTTRYAAASIRPA